MREMPLEFEKGSAYVDYGKTRLWVDKRLVTRKRDGAVIVYPVKNGRIEDGNVLRPATGYTTFDILILPGYRSSSRIEVIEPNPEAILEYEARYRTRNSGTSYGKVVSVRGDYLIYRWFRSGRLHGSPATGITCATSDGKMRALSYED